MTAIWILEKFLDEIIEWMLESCAYSRTGLCRYRPVDQWWQKSSRTQCWYLWSISSWGTVFTGRASSAAVQGVPSAHRAFLRNFSLQKVWAWSWNLLRPGCHHTMQTDSMHSIFIPLSKASYSCPIFWYTYIYIFSFINLYFSTLDWLQRKGRYGCRYRWGGTFFNGHREGDSASFIL